MAGPPLSDLNDLLKARSVRTARAKTVLADPSHRYRDVEQTGLKSLSYCCQQCFMIVRSLLNEDTLSLENNPTAAKTSVQKEVHVF